MITLKSITILDENMPECIALTVHPEQDNLVRSNVLSLADAYDTEKDFAETGEGPRAKCYAVYENDTMVGFTMYGYSPPEPGETEETEYRPTENIYIIWILFIDKNHQRKGIGKEVVRQVMDEIKTKPFGDANYCYVSYVPDNIGSKMTWANYGFEEDGRVLDGEAVASIMI